MGVDQVPYTDSIAACIVSAHFNSGLISTKMHENEHAKIRSDLKAGRADCIFIVHLSSDYSLGKASDSYLALSCRLCSMA